MIDFFESLMLKVSSEIDAFDWTALLGRDAGISVTGRAKTRGTLFDKLRRTPEIGLGYIRDIAGVRIVGDFTLSEEDLIVRHLVDSLDPHAKVIDRRAEPQAGYRAVHVVVTSHEAFVEIQVRTDLQAIWAEVYERLADTIGRGIRYGEPSEIERPAVARLIQGLQEISTVVIADLERLEQQVDNSLKTGEPIPQPVSLGSTTVRLDAPVEVVRRYVEEEKRQVRETLRRLLVRLEHVGPRDD